MTVGELRKCLNARTLTEGGLERRVTGGLVCDVMSMTLSKGFSGMAWVTHQANMNALAAAYMTEAACVVFPEGLLPDDDVIKQAEREHIALLSMKEGAFDVAARMSEAGLCGKESK